MAKGSTEPGRQIAGDSGDAPGVGPVGLDLEIEHDVGFDPERSGERHARCHALDSPFLLTLDASSEDPGLVVRKPELPSRTEHPVGRDAFHRDPPDLHPAGKDRADGASTTRSPRSKLVAPHTTSVVEVPSSTTTRRIRSAPGIAAISSTRATTNAFEAFPDHLDPLDDQSEVVEGGGQFGRFALDGREVGNHDSGTRTDTSQDPAIRTGGRTGGRSR